MSLSDKAVEEFKVLLEKRKGEPVTDAEAREGAENLYQFFELLLKGAEEDARRKRRLRQEPDGYELEGSYSCCICRNTARGTNHLYTKWGILCRSCHSAILVGIIPPYVATSRHSYFLDWQLQSDFKIHPQTMRKYVRQGALKARIILTPDGKPYEYVFLRRENSGLVSRESPARKSYDRHRNKVSDRQVREERARLRAEFAAEHAKLKRRRSQSH
ncbi:MAG: hypothetical protein KGI78_01920 [Patescibacteria group bacterium]|nr:hypothetical protein [Patescibacteria group bacterium]MDE1944083.1 hypothetical protein [Patescibacteria group bacterium]MDE1945476.1 hypothetical protein [Patescibacteria group bacterium]MDE2057591.1 hypothetical protein [Patescibacteria group bacterium]